MTAHVGTLSVDGTPISRTDLARIEAEELLHSQQQRSAVKVVAASALDAEDCRMMLSILGLSDATARAARGEFAPAPIVATRPRKSQAA